MISTQIVFLKEFFDIKLILKKKSADDKKAWTYTQEEKS